MSNILTKLFTVDAGHKRIFGLDLLRCMAISLVLLAHGRMFLQPIFGKTNIKLLTTGGFLGVEMFFVLSGFLIGSILIKICDREGNLSFNSLKDFWKRRWYRTLPTYYLILIASTLVGLMKGKHLLSQYSYYLYFIFSHKLVPGIKGLAFFDETWSLAIEEWFYLTLPIFVIIFLNLGKEIINKHLKYRLLGAIVFLIILGLAVRLFFLLKFNFGSSSITILRMDSIIWGVLFAWANFYFKSWFNSVRNVFFIIGLVIIAHSTYVYANMMSTGVTSFYFNSFYYVVTDIGFACLLPICNNLVAIKSKRLTKIITIISLISYSMYLTHITFAINIILILRKVGVPIISRFQTSVIPGLIGLCLFWSITIIISTLLFNFYEKPLTQLRDKKRMSEAVIKS